MRTACMRRSFSVSSNLEARRTDDVYAYGANRSASQSQITDKRKRAEEFSARINFAPHRPAPTMATSIGTELREVASRSTGELCGNDTRVARHLTHLKRGRKGRVGAPGDAQLHRTAKRFRPTPNLERGARERSQLARWKRVLSCDGTPASPSGDGWARRVRDGAERVVGTVASGFLGRFGLELGRVLQGHIV